MKNPFTRFSRTKNPLKRRFAQKSRYIALLVCFTLLSLLVFCSACFNSLPQLNWSAVSSTGNKILTVTGGVHDFLFECPESYFVSDDHSTHETVSFYLEDPGRVDSDQVTFLIKLTVLRMDQSFRSYQDLKNAESSLATKVPWAKQTTIAQQAITITGVEAEEVVESIVRYSNDDSNNKTILESTIIKSVRFDYKHSIWSLKFYYDVKESNTRETEYKHILQTFKILD